jgi:hypothetical protein
MRLAIRGEASWDPRLTCSMLKIVAAAEVVEAADSRN